MAPQSNGDVATASMNSRYVREVTVGDHTIGLFYPGTMEVGFSRDHSGSFNERVRLATIPPDGYEEDLRAAIKSLRRSKHGNDVLKYLPIGTFATYRPQPSLNNKSDQIPIEVGIADEIVGDTLDKVVAVVELWLKRRLNGLQ